ncbi:hypothetical protein, partial [Marinagarivorans algicola]
MQCLLLIFLSLTSCVVHSFENSKVGIGISESNKFSLWNTSIAYAVARQGLRVVEPDESINAYLDKGVYVYSLSTKPSIQKIKTEGRITENNWPLTRWPYESIEPEIPFRLTNHQLGEMDFGVNAYHSSLGCLDDSPLRYGDIEG